MKYAMLLCGEERSTWGLPPEVMEEAYKDIIAWFEKWQARGKIAEGGAELDAPRKSKSIRRGADGELVVTDGPYLELKEVVGGIVILEADSMEEAVAIASDGPWYGDAASSVEIRPIMEQMEG